MLDKLKKYKNINIFLFTISILLSSEFAKAATDIKPNFAQYAAGKERKAAFFNYFAPLIRQANQKTLQLRQRIQRKAYQPEANRLWFLKVAKFYYMKDFNPSNKKDIEELLKRVDIVPVSLALAQAANESGWGTSRFAVRANNYFGQWCFSKGCGMVPNSRNRGAKHEIRAFDHPYQSVVAYILNLNRHRSYKELRELRYLNRKANQPINSLALATGLIRYSQRKDAYVKELQSMIRYNKLQQFDR